MSANDLPFASVCLIITFAGAELCDVWSQLRPVSKTWQDAVENYCRDVWHSCLLLPSSSSSSSSSSSLKNFSPRNIGAMHLACKHGILKLVHQFVRVALMLDGKEQQPPQFTTASTSLTSYLNQQQQEDFVWSLLQQQKQKEKEKSNENENDDDGGDDDKDDEFPHLRSLLTRPFDLINDSLYTMCPIHVACRYGHPAVVAYILSLSRLLDSKFSSSRRKAFADLPGKAELVKEANLALRGGQAAAVTFTPAERAKDWKAAGLNMGVTPGGANYRTSHHRTPLMCACQHARANLTVVQLLLAENVDVNAKDKVSQTALVIAAQNDNADLIRLLLQYGADVNATQRSHDMTPLIMSCSRNLLDNVRVLMEEGKADHDRVTTWGASAHDFAVHHKNEEMERLVPDAVEAKKRSNMRMECAK